MTSAASTGRGTISVVIPVADERFLREAMESVFAQDYRPVEVVVVDSSKDGVGWVVDRYGSSVRYDREAPRGIGAARNRGVELASGGSLVFLDADDLCVPGRFSLQAAALERDPSLEAVFGCVSEFVEPGLPAHVVAGLRAPRASVPSHLTLTMLITRAAFDRVGPFAPDYVVGESIEWYARAMSAGLRSVTLDDVVIRRRLHGANTGVRSWSARGDFVRVAREALARKRAAESAREV